MMDKRPTAVYGGSFNMFGNNHLDVIRYVAESGEFSRIVMVPSIAHPLKKAQFPYEHRVNMTQLGVNARFHASMSFPRDVSIEVSMAEMGILKKQTSPIYTIDLLRHLQSGIGGKGEYKFVVGPDIIEDIDRWKFVDEIHEEFGFFEVPDMGLHVSQVREMIANGISTWDKHVPPEVAHYIRLHKLYHVERVTCDHDLDEDDGAEICDKCGLHRIIHQLDGKKS